MRSLGSRPDFGVTGIRAAIADVLRYVGGEDHRILRHQPDPGPDLCRIRVEQRHAIQPNDARGRVVKSQQKLKNSGLSRP